MKDILNGLNKEQVQAVTTVGGQLLVIAGAGTGKTTVIARRIAHIIEKKLAKPAEILALTFTDKAAQEMEERVDVLVPYGWVDTWISTFHAFGDRVLRQHCLEVGLPPDFRVMTKPEQFLFVQQNLFRFNLEYFRPLANPTKYIQALLALVSRAKDEDVDHNQYLKFAQKITGDRAEQEKQVELSRFFADYERFKAQAGLVDFGDLVVLALKLFRDRPQILGQYQERFKYILVDEYQDTNYAQNEIVKLLSYKHKNICVVGDDDQCLPAGTKIKTLQGEKAIELIKAGDEVITAVGKGHLSKSKVTAVIKNAKKVRLLTFTTENGYSLTTTDNHKMFCYVPPRQSSSRWHHVYLMNRSNLGWRIGVTCDLAQRLRLERSADTIVGLRTFTTDTEARYHEMLWALKYGIPPNIFKARAGIAIQGDYLTRLYKQLDTIGAAYKLADDLHVDLNSPHYSLNAVTRGTSRRIKINIELCTRRYVSKSTHYNGLLQNPHIAHSVNLETSNKEIIKKIKNAGFPFSRAKRGIRVRIESNDIKKIGKLSEQLQIITGGIIEGKFSVGTLNSQNLPALLIPAGNVLTGHFLPIVKGFRVFYDRVVNVAEKTIDDVVYDLEVERTHNFVANGIVVHNSIYKFRGAAISNILQFKRNFPKTRQVVLTQNYRSSQAILDAAYRLIKHNDPDRLEVKNKINKKLRSVKREYGQAPQELFGQTLSDETDLVAEEILKLTSQKTKTKKDQTSFKDIVILVRANSQAPAFMRSLNMRQIPHKFLGSSGLYDLEEIRNLISFLRAVSHFDDSLNLYNLATSDYYGLSMEDCIRCMDWASRKNKTLHWVFENIGKTDIEISDKSQKIIKKLITDLKKYAEISRKQKVGRVLYEFLKDSGIFDRKDFSGEDQSKIQNIAKFFEKIQEFSFLAQEESVRNFTDYLEFMRVAGDDPATAEVDPDQDAVGIMTVHAAKGLEFKVVFLVNLVSERFPARDRGELIELPVGLIKETLPVGDYHLEEERRLFYVGITRAKELIYFTWSKDYGGKRLRKISPFVLEALDRQQVNSQSIKKSSLEKITRIALSDASPNNQLVLLDNRVIRLSQQQVDDYLTCPLKYRYASIMRIPVLKHHTVVYGAALHKAVETFYRQKMAGKTMSLSPLLEVFENSWDQEGFLSAQHEELRLSQGKKVLENFWQREKSNPILPTFIEKPFRVGFGQVQLVGRMDRVDVIDGKVTILDFKSSENVTQEQANRRARESVQLGIYALAYYKIYGQIPDRVGLYFLENGIVGALAPDQDYLSKVEQWIKQTEQGILSGNFAAQPSFLACAFCVFNSICPFTATKV